jgi:hypothetical protein
MIVRSCFALLALTALSGCGVTGSTSFRDMSTAYRDVLEDYANDNILLNIVRSSESMPVSFLDMPNVIGTGSLSTNVVAGATIISAAPNSFPGFFSAATGSSVAPSATLSASTAFNFTQSSLDNAAFMSAFLSDLKPDAIHNLTNNSVGPKSILYTLAIDTLELRDSNNKPTVKLANDPFSPNYPKFQEALYRLIEGGLSTELVTEQVPLSPPMTADKANENMRAMVAAYAQPGVVLTPAKLENGKPGYQLTKIIPTMRMCLQRQTEFPDQIEFQAKFSSGAFCSLEPGTGDPTAVKSKDQIAKQKIEDQNKQTLVVNFRSTRAIFDFLGALTVMQTGPNPKYVMIKNSDQFSKNPSLISEQANNKDALPLFVILKNNTSVRPLAKITYRGNTYTIPEENAGATRQVIGLLAQILTLNKVPGSIPASPAVLIK